MPHYEAYASVVKNVSSEKKLRATLVFLLVNLTATYMMFMSKLLV